MTGLHHHVRFVITFMAINRLNQGELVQHGSLLGQMFAYDLSRNFGLHDTEGSTVD